MANNNFIFNGALQGATGGVHERWITDIDSNDYLLIRNAVVSFATTVDALIPADPTIVASDSALIQSICGMVLAGRYLDPGKDNTNIARAIAALYQTMRGSLLPEASIIGSDDVLNDSLVPGTTLTDVLNTLSQGYLFEDFNGGLSTWTGAQDGRIGNLAWSSNLSGGTISGGKTASATTQGNVNISISNGGNRGAVFLGSALANTGGIFNTRANFWQWRAQPNSSGAFTGGATRIGFARDPVSATFGTDGIWFDAEPFVQINWRVLARRGNAATQTVITTLPCGFGGGLDGQMTQLNALKLSNGDWEMSINGTVVATLLAANAPINQLYPCIQCQSAGGAVGSCFADSFLIGYNRF